MSRSPPAQRDTATPEQVQRAFVALSTSEQQSLRQIARLRALGLSRLGWEDLLHEALYRTLAGTRRWPLEIGLVAFLAQVMRSIASEERERMTSDPIDFEANTSGGTEDASLIQQARDPQTPETRAMTSSLIRQIEDLFEDDVAAIHVLRSLAEGLSPSETQGRYRMTQQEYASAQRRIQRSVARKFGSPSHE